MRILISRHQLHQVFHTAGVACLLLAAHSSTAQQTNAERDSKRLQRIEVWAKDDFSQRDTDGDGSVSGHELSTGHGEFLSDVGWSESMVLKQFDHNNDSSLQANEYVVFISHLIDARLRLLTTEEPVSITTAANELASEAVDGAVVPEEYSPVWTDAVPIDSLGVAVPKVNGSYDRLALSVFNDMELVNLKGEPVGDIQDVVVSDDGSEQGFVIELGGFFGIGATEVFVPLASVYLVGEQLVWESLLDSDTIKERESYHYDEDGFTSVMQN